MADFQKRHYLLITEILRSVSPCKTWDDGINTDYDDGAVAAWERTCLAFLNHFKCDNPQFKGDKFLAACKPKGDT